MTLSTAFMDTGHDHANCMESALDRASALCGERGVRLTPLRRRVLELVWVGHKPLGAYEILETLKAERRGAAPPPAGPRWAPWPYVEMRSPAGPSPPARGRGWRASA